MHKTGSLAIIVPTYNHEKWIGQALDSLNKHKPANSKVWVHDDGSSDRTGEIAKAKCREHGFSFSQSQNRGLPRTLNHLLFLSAPSDFVFVFAGDDLVVSGGLDALLQAGSADSSLGGVYGRVDMIDENNQFIKELPNDGVSGMLFEDIVLGDKVVPQPFIMWSRAALEEVGGYDERFKIEDTVIFRKISRNRPIKFVDTKVLLYRKIGLGMSSNVVLMVSQAEEINKLLKDDVIYPRLIRVHAVSAFCSLAKSHKIRALRYLPRALLSGRHRKLLVGIFRLLFCWGRLEIPWRLTTIRSLSQFIGNGKKNREPR